MYGNTGVMTGTGTAAAGVLASTGFPILFAVLIGLALLVLGVLLVRSRWVRGADDAR